MAREELLLFAPPEPPVRLEAGEEIVLGRSRSCGLPLRSGQASRRHAAVRCGPGGAGVRDLGSTNGTYVNGERVEGERLLAPGDRIEIGDVGITFCRVESGDGDGFATEEGEAQTMIAEGPARASAPGALSGDLAQVPLFAVLQMLEMGGQTGVLEVDGPDGAGHLWLARGAPVHGATEKDEGLDAALAVAQLGAGRFEFAPSAEIPEATFALSMMELVLEASRLLDEKA